MSKDRIVNMSQWQRDGYKYSKKIAWPMYVWKGIIAKDDNLELDPLQKLIISLLKVDGYDSEMLQHQLGISKEVLKAARQKCVENGYLDFQGNLTEKAKGDSKNSIKRDMEELDSSVKVCIFRDAVSGDIVPEFGIEKLERPEKMGHADYILLEKEEGNKRPTFYEFETALDISNRIKRQLNNRRSEYGSEDIKMSELELEAILEEIESDEATLSNQGYKTLAEELEAEEGKKKSLDNEENILKLWEEYGYTMYFESNVYIDIKNIETFHVVSPFGEDLDAWFTNSFRRVYSKNENLKSDIESLKEKVVEEYKQKIAFNNFRDIELFDRNPILANYDEFSYFRDTVVEVMNDYSRIVKGDGGYKSFFTNCQVSLECLLGIICEDKYDLRKYVQPYNFKSYLDQLSNRLDIQIPNNFKSKAIGENIKKLRKGNGYIKDRSLLLLIESDYTDKEYFINLLKEYPDFFDKINMISYNRNQRGHFNERRAELDKQMSKEDHLEKIEEIKSAYDDIVNALSKYCIKEIINGKK